MQTHTQIDISIDRLMDASNLMRAPRIDMCTKEILLNKHDDDEKESRKNEL